MSAVQATTTLEQKNLADPQAQLARQFLYHMCMMREMEERIERKLYRQGKIVGGVYVGRGQEAIPVGTAMLAEPEDVLFPSHRDMAVFLIRGVHPRQIFAQYMGRVGGLTRGKDGNMHMGDMRLNVVSIISAMAACVPVATGAALALKYRGTRNAAFCYFGDGATSRGDWHEGINLASVQKLPLVLICNNNQYAYSTPLEKQMACANVADRGVAYGIPSEVVDGNDVFAVHEACGRALAHARGGQGPYLIECKTFRMTGHSAHDPGDYVPRHLWDEWAKKDPIKRLERVMLDRGWAEPADLEEWRADVAREVDEAILWAENSPFPDASELLDHVYEKR
ncbi:MAG TPA: thiamine pyrophosphate-dependent dehydrogenase E1 component subunit alpha [Bryobacteraceae bacterium]|nr:thiamine pyrophosphate-dependent dehydrogenase E1 component subunit alpha [Bryobacteraceae bacterium]